VEALKTRLRTDSEDGYGGTANEVEGDLTVEHEHNSLAGFYLAIGAALLVLTATTVAAAFVNLGPFNPSSRCSSHHQSDAGHHFLHARQRRKRKAAGAIVVSGFFFLAILIVFTVGGDYMTRSWR